MEYQRGAIKSEGNEQRLTFGSQSGIFFHSRYSCDEAWLVSLEDITAFSNAEASSVLDLKQVNR